ncbi:MAG: hypothetical protein ACI910_003331 [Oleispira sp.]|jgi:hypothetical protein
MFKKKRDTLNLCEILLYVGNLALKIRVCILNTIKMYIKLHLIMPIQSRIFKIGADMVISTIVEVLLKI